MNSSQTEIIIYCSHLYEQHSKLQYSKLLVLLMFGAGGTEQNGGEYHGGGVWRGAARKGNTGYPLGGLEFIVTSQQEV